jgi:hypothetical protein
MPKIIALATVLKAIDDARNFEKLGLFFAYQNPENQVHVIGFDNGTSPEMLLEKVGGVVAEDRGAIFFHPLFRFSRLSPRRLGAGFRLLKWLLRFRPQIVLIGAVELLWVGFLYKVGYDFFCFLFLKSKNQKTRLFYDMRENYYRNIRYQKVYPAFLKRSLAGAVRLYERFFTKFYEGILVAERCYAVEIGFLSKRKYEVIENKFKPNVFLSDPALQVAKKSNEWLLTGTFTEVYGTLEGIAFFEKLQAHLPLFAFHLQVVGYAPSAAYREKIREWVEKSPFSAAITLDLAACPLPHSKILAALQRTSYLLLPYLPNASTQNCIPTKLYEGLFFKNKILIQNNPFWQKEFASFNACFFVDFRKPTSHLFSETAFLAWLNQSPAQEAPSEAILWQGEAKKLARFLQS